MDARGERSPAVTEAVESGNPALRAAMAAVARSRTEQTMRDLFAALIASLVVVPVRGETENGVELAVVEGGDATTYFHAFTDASALEAFAGGSVRYVAMGAPGLAATVLSDPTATLLINAAGPDGGQLSRRDLEFVRDGLVPGFDQPARTTSETSLRIFTLSEDPPEGLVTALRATGERLPAVLALHGFEGALGAGDRHLFVGADFDHRTPDEQRQGCLSELSAAARPHVPADDHMDFIALPPEYADPVAAAGRLLWARNQPPTS